MHRRFFSRIIDDEKGTGALQYYFVKKSLWIDLREPSPNRAPAGGSMLVHPFAGPKNFLPIKYRLKTNLSYRTGTLKKLMPSVRIYYTLFLSTGWTEISLSSKNV
jgi:hypothetical protein